MYYRNHSEIYRPPKNIGAAVEGDDLLWWSCVTTEVRSSTTILIIFILQHIYFYCLGTRHAQGLMHSDNIFFLVWKEAIVSVYTTVPKIPWYPCSLSHDDVLNQRSNVSFDQAGWQPSLCARVLMSWPHSWYTSNILPQTTVDMLGAQKSTAVSSWNIKHSSL